MIGATTLVIEVINVPKVLKREDLPPMPPPINIDELDDEAKRAWIASVTDEPASYRRDGQCLPGVPWWIEMVCVYFTARDIMLALGISRRVFVALHEAGAIPGAAFAYTSDRQRKKQRVVRRIDYVRYIIANGCNWYVSDLEEQLPPSDAA